MGLRQDIDDAIQLDIEGLDIGDHLDSMLESVNKILDSKRYDEVAQRSISAKLAIEHKNVDVPEGASLQEIAAKIAIDAINEAGLKIVRRVELE